MKCSFKQGDRVVVLDLGEHGHGTVSSVRLDGNGVPLVYVDLDEARTDQTLGYDIWTARTFELREEGENGE
jgi:hypothetical protein